MAHVARDEMLLKAARSKWATQSECINDLQCPVKTWCDFQKLSLHALLCVMMTVTSIRTTDVSAARLSLSSIHTGCVVLGHLMTLRVDEAELWQFQLRVDLQRVLRHPLKPQLLYAVGVYNIVWRQPRARRDAKHDVTFYAAPASHPLWPIAPNVVCPLLVLNGAVWDPDSRYKSMWMELQLLTVVWNYRYVAVRQSNSTRNNSCRLSLTYMFLRSLCRFGRPLDTSAASSDN